MNREIKFRAWSNKERRMESVGSLNFNHYWNYKLFSITAGNPKDSSWMCHSEMEEKNNVLEELVLMQFTGLKDKKGKDIYEGDIVKGVVRLRDLGQHLFDRKKDIKLVEFKHKDELFGKNPYYSIWVQYDLLGEVKWYPSDSSFIIDDLVRKNNIWRLFGGGGEGLAETHRLEVIGNIYQNKDLISGEISDNKANPKL